MIQIEINRYTIMKLEEAMEKYNKKATHRINGYLEFINKMLDEFLKVEKA